MHKLLAALFIACFCFAAVPVAAIAGAYVNGGQFAGAVNPQVAAAFAAYKNGGSLDALVNTIITLVVADPSLADDVIYLAQKSGNPDLELAMASALGQAYAALIAAGRDSGAARVMTAAQLSLIPLFQTQLTSAAGTANGGATLYGGNTNTNPATLSCDNHGTVSPTSPSSGC